MKYSILKYKTVFFTASFLFLASFITQKIEAETTDAARALVRESIKAHGGIEKWRSNGALKFRWTYHMTDAGKVVDSVQTVDPVSMNAFHTVPNSDEMFGHSNGKYWVSEADIKFFPPPRFWTLTPIYFLGIPFVFEDDNANFELLSDKKEFKGKKYSQVKITYRAGAGDSPDDYYVLLIDPDTKLTRGAYYTVTHPLLYKGGELVEKFISLDKLTNVDGLSLAGGHQSFSMSSGVISKKVIRHTDISEVEFLPREDVDFSIPNGAKLLD